MPAKTAREMLKDVLVALMITNREQGLPSDDREFHRYAAQTAHNKYVDWVREQVREQAYLAAADLRSTHPGNAAYCRVELLDLVHKTHLPPKVKKAWDIWMALYIAFNGNDEAEITALAASAAGVPVLAFRPLISKAKAAIAITAGIAQRKNGAQRP